MTALSPSEPAPRMTTLLPGCTSSVFKIAPAPVCTPQPSGPRVSSAKPLSTLTAECDETTECDANDDCPKKCEPTALPLLSVSDVVPSIRPGGKPTFLRFSGLNW
jgi:hypothetical protein